MSACFFDGKCFIGGVLKKNIPTYKRDYRASARDMLEMTGADHVLYCLIEYDDVGEMTSARFYSGVGMSDDEFYDSVGNMAGDFFVGAVHKMK